MQTNSSQLTDAITITTSARGSQKEQREVGVEQNDR